MAFVNYSTREINVKIVYYGAGLSGKTANLQYLYSRAPSHTRGRLISLATETERTLFFDFLPMNLGTLRGFQVRFHLYTVPGQVFYEASRKLILKGVDGLLFVADSDPLRLDANAESYDGLLRNLHAYQLSVPPLPMVIQYNKRDVPGALSVAELHGVLGNPDLPQFESVAVDGTGVFESLKALARGVLNTLQTGPLRTDDNGFSASREGTGGTVEQPPGPGSQPVPAAGSGSVTPAPGSPPGAAAVSPPKAVPEGPKPVRQSPPRQMPEAVSGIATAKPAQGPSKRPAPVRQSSSPAEAPMPPTPRPSRPTLVKPVSTGAVAKPTPAEKEAPAPASGVPEKRRGFGWFRRSR